MLRLCVALSIMIVVINLSTAAAQSAGEDILVFAWNGELYAHTIPGGTVTVLGPATAGFAAEWPGYDVYTLTAAPLAESPGEGYGFQHGVWSLDHTRFAYLEINPPRFRVRMQTVGGDNRLLLEGELSAAQGYLDPVGWTADGDIVLLERVLLNHLHTVKTWRYELSSSMLHYFAFVPLERLSGRSALLSDGATVFLGFNLAQQIGFVLDVPSKQVQSFDTQLAQVLPPQTGFEYHPLQVVGALNADDLAALNAQMQQGNGITNTAPSPDPFLHWPLPDAARSITCYPDSAWTTANFDVTCPGLSAPHDYVGHQGTDVGGKPDGLPLGTLVYPAASGVVVATVRDCGADQPNCNNSYGNTVTLEHVLIANGTTQVWYTGYGHLQTVLVDDYTYLADLTAPIAHSGATGVGGPHLHFEVRSVDSWVDPWDNRDGVSLWLGSNAHPLAATGTSDVEAVEGVLAVCTSFAGNNIRSEPGTAYDVVAQTADGVTYDVLEIRFVDTGGAQGDWYRVQFEGGTGWLWSGLLTCL